MSNVSKEKKQIKGELSNEKENNNKENDVKKKNKIFSHSS